MTQDEIMEMAEKAGFTAIWKKQYIISPYGFEDADLKEELEAFAKLVAAKEREACAKVCEGLNLYGGSESRQLQRATLKDCAFAIRARGEA